MIGMALRVDGRTVRGTGLAVLLTEQPSIPRRESHDQGSRGVRAD